jgi:hypothetical protein
MPAWTGERGGKWLRHTAESLSAMFGEVEVDAGIVPPLLDVVAEARPTLAGPSTPDTAVVLVPAPAAFIAFPSSSPRKLIAKGLDPDKLTGDVQFEVHVNADGRIGMVRVEGDELFDQAFALVGEHSAIDLMSSVEAQITLSHYGEAVRVSVPPRSQVMTPDEFAAARG